MPFEQKYKIFLIYFSGTKWQNCAVHICTVSDTPSTPPPLRSARRGLSGIECRPAQRVQRLGVCRCALHSPPCIWHGLPCRLYCSVVPGALGCSGAPAGYTAAAQPRPVSPVTTEKIKKAQKITLPPIINSKNFPQKQKDPYKGSAFCAILSLQALKGRNLQWLKVK